MKTKEKNIYVSPEIFLMEIQPLEILNQSVGFNLDDPTEDIA